MSLPFKQVWAVDFEYTASPGEHPVPICMVARELRTGRTIRLWKDQFGPEPPFPVDANSIFVAYSATAEFSCFYVLGWPIPARILDLFVEFANLTSGIIPRSKGSHSLLAALAHFGIHSVDAEEKKFWRDICIRGGPYTTDEREGLMDYCETDVVALDRLLPAMLPYIDLPRALLRGRYMFAAAAMEHNGVPIDVPTLNLFREHWSSIQDKLVADVDALYGAFSGRTFKIAQWGNWLIRNDIPWPLLKSGQLDLEDDTFREMSKVYPSVSLMHELRQSLSKLRLSGLEVGQDGRNRTWLNPFGSRTSRNQPSNSRFVFGPATWLRGLIKPPPDHGVAYIDFTAQEFGIGAALSGDSAMVEAYLTGDVYLAFAKQIGAVPQDATKNSHEAERQLFKACILGMNYGMGEYSLAQRIGRPNVTARHLISAYRETYKTFWEWSEAGVDHAQLRGFSRTMFGWHWHLSNGQDANPRNLRNFPMQASGAEMMRLAACLGTERGVEIVAPVHDAFLICAPLDQLERDITTMRAAMAEASRVVLSGFEISTDYAVVRYPGRFMDKRGAEMWRRVSSLVGTQSKWKAA